MPKALGGTLALKTGQILTNDSHEEGMSRLAIARHRKIAKERQSSQAGTCKNPRSLVLLRLALHNLGEKR